MNFEFKNQEQIKSEDNNKISNANFIASIALYLIPFIGCFSVLKLGLRPANRLLSQSTPKNIFRLHAIISLLWWPLFIVAQMIATQNFIFGAIVIIAVIYAPIHYAKYLSKFMEAVEKSNLAI